MKNFVVIRINLQCRLQDTNGLLEIFQFIVGKCQFSQRLHVGRLLVQQGNHGVPQIIRQAKFGQLPAFLGIFEGGGEKRVLGEKKVAAERIVLLVAIDIEGAKAEKITQIALYTVFCCRVTHDFDREIDVGFSKERVDLHALLFLLVFVGDRLEHLRSFHPTEALCVADSPTLLCIAQINA